jgi:hypothetical protein
VLWISSSRQHLFLGGHYRLGLAQIDEEVVALAAPHRAGDDVADLVLKIVEDPVLLELPQPLHHRLAGGLGRDAPQRGRVDGLL